MAGDSGIFDVTVDNWPIYSRFATNDFPDEVKIIEELRLKQGS